MRFLWLVVLIIIFFSLFLLLFPPIREKEPKNTTTTLSGEKTEMKEVLIHSNSFEPLELSIKLNEKVKWTNKDVASHQLICESENQERLFDVILAPSESFEFYIFSNTECWDPSMGGEARMKIFVS